MSQEKLAVIVQKCVKDQAFKRRLMADPKGVLAEEGILVRNDVEIKVVEDTPRVVHLVLSVEPSGELSEAELEGVTGGRASSQHLAYNSNLFAQATTPHSHLFTTTPPPH